MNENSHDGAILTIPHKNQQQQQKHQTTFSASSINLIFDFNWLQNDKDASRFGAN
jgi:hypothetical protein